MRSKTAVLLSVVTASFAGCASLPRVSIGQASARAPADNGTPAVVSSDVATTTIPLPALTEMSLSPFVPSAEVPCPTPPGLRLTLPTPSVLTMTAKSERASSGTIDTSVAMHKADNAERRRLLYAGLFALVGVPVFLWLKYPTGAALSGIGSGLLLLAWRLAGLPDWFWLLGAGAVVVAAGIYFGYERAEKDSAKPKK